MPLRRFGSSACLQADDRAKKASVMYRVTAVRSTKRGKAAMHMVLLGLARAGQVTAAAAEAGAAGRARIAA